MGADTTLFNEMFNPPRIALMDAQHANPHRLRWLKGGQGVLRQWAACFAFAVSILYLWRH
jgi:hypothetical protein